MNNERIHPHTDNRFIPPLENSTLIPPTGFSLSEDVDSTASFILTEYGLDLRVLRGCDVGLKSPKKVQKFTRNRPPLCATQRKYEKVRERSPSYLTRELLNQWRGLYLRRGRLIPKCPALFAPHRRHSCCTPRTS